MKRSSRGLIDCVSSDMVVEIRYGSRESWVKYGIISVTVVVAGELSIG